MKILLFLLAFSAVSFADELEKAFEKIRENHYTLQSYLATYESTNQQGEKAIFETGLHRESLWAFVKTTKLNKDGSDGPTREIWSTEDGNYIVNEDGRIEIVAGVNALMQQSLDLLEIFVSKEDRDPKPQGLHAWSYLSQEEVIYGISFNNTSLPWLRTPDKLLDENEKTVQVGLPDHGKITIDRSNGLITDQEIEVEDGARSMKLMNLKINPGKEAIAGKMKIDLTGADIKELAESGLRQSILHSFFQEIIETTAEDDEGQQKLAKIFTKTENKFVIHLDDLPVEKSPFFKKELLFGLTKRITAQLQKAAAEKGQDIDEIVILRHPKIQNDIERNLVKILLPKAKSEMRAVYVREMLGKELKARGRKQNQARKQTETFLERVYFRARVRRALNAYIKQL